MKVSLRPVDQNDEEFLLSLYASTRREELAGCGWSPEQEMAFFRMQYMAQKRSYEISFPKAQHDMILAGSHQVGRIMVSRTGAGIHLVDIALLPEFRGQRIGSTLLLDLLAEALSCGKPVTLQVSRTNRARTLYDRLGFVQVSEDEMYCEMKWSPAEAAQRP